MIHSEQVGIRDESDVERLIDEARADGSCLGNRGRPADNRVLEAAAETEVDVIVSGDRHLLALESWRGIAIQTPAAFLAGLSP